MTPELPAAMLGVLGEGRQAHVAVASRRGPHVTPELYTWSGGRLWFAAAATTLKAKVLQRNRTLAAVVSVAGRSVILTGEATAFDPLRPTDLLRSASDAPRLARALTSYTTRNAVDLAAFVGDTFTGRLGMRPPPRRVLFALAPSRAALVENDLVVDRQGWGTPVPADGGPPGHVPAGGERAVVALPGPVALPGRWFADERRVHVPGQLLELVELDRTFPMSVVTDDYNAPGPAAKRGSLVRGEGRVVDRGASMISVDPHRVVEWDGVETSSVDTG
jgi:hypothetical protein